MKSKEEIQVDWKYSFGLITLMVFCILYVLGKVNFFLLDMLFNLSNCPNLSKKFWMMIAIAMSGYIFYSVTILRAYGLEQSKYDFMHKLKDSHNQFTNWEWSHFLSYMIYALICPDDWKYVFIAGVGFEFFELFVGYISNDQDFWTSQADNIISFDDVKANVLGYGFGHIISSFLK